MFRKICMLSLISASCVTSIRAMDREGALVLPEMDTRVSLEMAEIEKKLAALQFASTENVLANARTVLAFDRLNTQFMQHDAEFEKQNKEFEKINTHFQVLNNHMKSQLGVLGVTLAELDARMARVEQKQVVDSEVLDQNKAMIGIIADHIEHKDRENARNFGNVRRDLTILEQRIDGNKNDIENRLQVMKGDFQKEIQKLKDNQRWYSNFAIGGTLLAGGAMIVLATHIYKIQSVQLDHSSTLKYLGFRVTALESAKNVVAAMPQWKFDLHNKCVYISVLYNGVWYKVSRIIHG